MLKIYSTLALFLALATLSGCSQSTPAELSELLEITAEAPTPVSTVVGVTSSQSVVIMPVAANYYPDVGLPASSNTPLTLTDKLKMKLYLIDKYQPGICFNRDKSLLAGEMEAYLKAQAPMAELIKENYQIKDDLEIYKRIKQLENVTLLRSSGGRYFYSLVDRQCCRQTIYEGEIGLVNTNFSERSTKQIIKEITCQ